MRKGRCRYTQPILIKAEYGLRDAVAAVARQEGISMSELVRRDLRALAAGRSGRNIQARSSASV
jgi:hypothetical protein